MLIEHEPEMSIEGFTCEWVALRNLLFFAVYIACDVIISSSSTA